MITKRYQVRISQLALMAEDPLIACHVNHPTIPTSRAG
jgi:hypothetical protein